MEHVILVDSNDKVIGEMEKLKAHQSGTLHRAFSVFLFNESNELLLQQRALTKYHSAGLWTNTCCSHPRMGENTMDAAKRRLLEEMGIECELEFAFSFIYKAELENGLIEHELDHVFTGRYTDAPNFDPNEVGDWKYDSIEHIKSDLRLSPELFTAWFKLAFEKICLLNRKET